MPDTGAHGGSTGLKPRFHNGTVLHDADVDIIEFTKPDKLLFPAQEPLFSFFPALTTRCMFDAIHLERDVPEASTMVRCEDKVGPLLKNVAKKSINIIRKAK